VAIQAEIGKCRQREAEFRKHIQQAEAAINLRR